ncbi:MAG: hypothetical protein QME64_09830, partial [bacterium]|nr:hypothetical protein [bacterium]
MSLRGAQRRGNSRLRGNDVIPAEAGIASLTLAMTNDENDKRASCTNNFVPLSSLIAPTPHIDYV